MEELELLYSNFITKHKLPEQCAVEVQQALEANPNSDPAIIAWLAAFNALWEKTVEML